MRVRNHLFWEILYECRSPAWLVTVAVIFTPIVNAQLDEPPLDAVDEPTSLEISNELQQRQASIVEMEIELGIYDPALIEAYTDLAAFYNEIGQYQDAVDLYRQALQVARISAGLNSDRQLPLIDRLISSNLALNDWQSTDDMHHLRYYLKNRLYDPADPRFVTAIDEMGQWKLRAMRENLLERNYRGLNGEASDLSDLYQNAIARIQSRPDYNEPSLLPLYQGKSQADLEIARYVAQTPYQYFEGTVSRYVYETVCSNVRDSQGRMVRSCYNIQRENPRYRQSQRDAKRFEVNRSIRAVEISINRLNDILQNNPEISPLQRQQVESQIRELQVQFQLIVRSNRQRSLF